MEFKKLKIEKGIAIPPDKSKKGYVDALRRLKKGDSVVLPIPVYAAGRSAYYVLGAGNYASRGVEGGTRVWRIK